MTITTAKQRCVRRGVRALPRLLPVAAALLAVSPASQAQWLFTPSVDLSETYTDNVLLREDELASNQFVTELRSGFRLTGKTRRTEVSASGEISKFHYSNDREGLGLNDSLRQYSADMKNTLADNLLYVDFSASSRRQSLLPFGPSADENRFSDLNQTDVKTWSVSPYFARRFGDTSAVLRYSRDSVESNRRTAFGNSLGSTILFNLAHGAPGKDLGWNVSYSDQQLDNELVGESSSKMFNATLRYQLSRTWAATVGAGYDRYDFEGPGADEKGHNWSVGGVWTPSLRTSVQASIGRHLYGNTGSLAALHRSRSAVWEINYSDSITSSRSQFLLPAAIDTASMLDRLFTSSIPDQLARQRAVAAYILNNGLPPSLIDNINYLSNRYARQKLLSASVIYNRARSAGTASIYRSERIAVSDQSSDSPLLGTEIGSLNDNLRLNGASAQLTYRLNGRANAVFKADYRFRESLTTGAEDRQRLLSVGINRRFGRNVLGDLELRRRSGGADIVGRTDYTEHALVASVNMQF